MVVRNKIQFLQDICILIESHLSLQLNFYDDAVLPTWPLATIFPDMTFTSPGFSGLKINRYTNILDI